MTEFKTIDGYTIKEGYFKFSEQALDKFAGVIIGAGCLGAVAGWYGVGICMILAAFIFLRKR